MATANLGVHIVLEDGAKAGLDALGLSFGGLYGTVGLLMRAWSELTPATKALGITAGLTGIAFGGMAGLLRSSVDAAAQLEYEMMKVQLTVNGASEAGDALTNTLVHIADTSIYTTAQVADAFSQLGIDGWNATQIMDGLGQTTIDFAEAARTQTVPAALLLGSAMKMFGANASDAARFADDLTFAMYNGQKNATNLQQAFNQVGPVAHALGINFDEVAVTLAYMGEKGYYGTRAGTALRYMLAGLLDPTAKARKEMESLGLASFDTAGKLISSKFFDAQGNFLGIANAVQVLGKQLDHLNPQQRAQALAEMFSVRGGQGALLLLQNYSQTLKSFSDLSGIEHATSVTDKAAKVTDTFNGAVLRVKTTWNDFKAMLGKADLGPLKEGFNGIANALDKFNTASPALHTFAGMLLTVATGGVGLLFVASSLGFMVRAAKELGVLKELGKIGEGFGKLAGPIRGLASAGSDFARQFVAGLPGMVGKAAKAAFDLHVGFFDAIARGIDKFASLDISGVPTKIIGAFKNIGPALQSLPGLLMTGLKGIPGLFSGMGSAALGAIPAIAGVAGAILPFLLIALAVAGAVAIVVLMFTVFRKQTMQLWQDISGGVNILDLLKQYFMVAFGQIKKTWNEVWPQIQPAMTQLFAALHQMIPLFQAIGVVIGAVLAIVLAVIVGIVNGFLHALPFIIGFFTGVFQVIGGITQLIVAIFTGKWGAIPGILGGIFGGLVKVVIAPFQVIWAFIGGFIGGIIGFFQHLFDMLLGHSIIPDIVKGATKFFTMMRDTVLSIVNALVQGALFVFHLFQEGVHLVMMAVLLILHAFVVGALIVVNAIHDKIINPITRGFQMLGNGIKLGLKLGEDAFHGFQNVVKSVIDNVVGFIATLLKSLEKIPGVGSIAKGIGGFFHIPGLAQGGVVTSPTLAMIGEGHEPEVVLPVSKMAAFMSNYKGAGQSGGSQQTHIHLEVGGREVATAVLDHLTGTLRQNGLGRAFR